MRWLLGRLPIKMGRTFDSQIVSDAVPDQRSRGQLCNLAKPADSRLIAFGSVAMEARPGVSEQLLRNDVVAMTCDSLKSLIEMPLHRRGGSYRIPLDERFQNNFVLVNRIGKADARVK